MLIRPDGRMTFRNDLPELPVGEGAGLRSCKEAKASRAKAAGSTGTTPLAQISCNRSLVNNKSKNVSAHTHVHMFTHTHTHGARAFQGLRHGKTHSPGLSLLCICFSSSLPFLLMVIMIVF